MVKNKFASAGDMRDMGLIPGLGDPREGMTTSTILAWIIQWTEEPRTHTCKLACPEIFIYG